MSPKIKNKKFIAFISIILLLIVGAFLFWHKSENVSVSAAGEAWLSGFEQRVPTTITYTPAATVVQFTTVGTSSWVAPTGVTSVDYLVVGGGGGGWGPWYGAGGGAGGVLSGAGYAVTPGNSYTVTVGDGGAAGTNGGNSVFNTFTAIGGGAGGACTNSSGCVGGSGGGGSGGNASAVGGAGTAGQGNAGGAGKTGCGYGNDAGGGGGGKGGAGTAATVCNTGGAGGVGIANSITGTSTYYAGGGGGAGSTTVGAGGNGGGGAGNASGNGVAGTYYGGGGGGTTGGSYAGGAGYKGIVILKYTTSSLTDYQVKVTVPYDSNMNTDFSDVRFTSSDGSTLLSYWREKYTSSSTATFWVKVPSIASGANTIYMYYGKTIATTSNGTNTFIFFDDFTGTTINTSKWVETDTGDNISQNGVLTINNGTAAWGPTAMYSVDNFNRADGLAVQGDYKSTMVTGTTYKDTTMLWTKDTGTGTAIAAFIYALYPKEQSGTTNLIMYEDGIGRGVLSGTFVANTQYTYRQIIKPSGALTQVSTDGGGTWTDLYNSTYSSEATFKVGFTHFEGGVVTIDDIFVRKYVASEPTVAFGTEENVINGSCGTSHGANFDSPPTVNLCATGTASAVVGSGPWTWTCTGSESGAGIAYCMANPTVSGESFISGLYTIEKYVGVGSTTWTVPAGVTSSSILLVAGGGGGGMDMGGGGGAGAVSYDPSYALTAGTKTITVGAGGLGAPGARTNGQPRKIPFAIPATKGGDTSFNGEVAEGGGFGGSAYYSQTPGIAGGNGGSGGGAGGYNPNAGTFYGGTATGIGGGNRGGNSTAQYYSGGGGGAGEAGADSTAQADGGDGVSCSILGTAYYWGGGGGGSGYTICGGNGGNGGGGGGAVCATTGGSGLNSGSAGGGGSVSSQTNKPGGDAGAFTGGGGGGSSHYYYNNRGGNGGSGIFVIKYLTQQLTGWKYRMPVTISNTSGAVLTDYQIKFTVNFVPGKMNTNFSDLRFTRLDGVTLLPHYLESKNNGVSAVIWVKVDSIPIAGTQIFMYYGKSDATSVSNFTNTNAFTTTGLVDWLKVDSLTGLSDGASVATFTDSSGSGNNAVQATTSMQPIYKTNILNGKPVLRFSNTNAQTMTISTNFPAPTTIIYVSRMWGPVHQRILAGLNNNWLLGYHGGKKQRAYFQGWVNTGSTDADTNWNLYSTTIGGTGVNSNFYENGINLASNQGGIASPNGLSLNGHMGTSELSDADIAEVLVYNSTLSDLSRSIIERYLANKYALTYTPIYADPTVAFGTEDAIGQCGTSDGQTFATKPTTNLCYTGNASIVAGEGPWDWTCTGVLGTIASCSANSFYTETIDDTKVILKYTGVGSTTWVAPTNVTSVDYLVVGGGGGGAGGLGGGGGGAGGFLTATGYTVIPGNSYTITVGAGGNGTNGDDLKGASGGNSVFATITANGGGGGGDLNGAGVNGGSGGGSGRDANSAGGGIGSQGHNGGNTPGSTWSSGSGGGGASQTGGNGSASGTTQDAAVGGKGGNGLASSITGTSVTYAGGGGGSAAGGTAAGAGGTGGGGAGGAEAAGSAGTDNLGGGGGGGRNGLGGDGGSGIVVISYSIVGLGTSSTNPGLNCSQIYTYNVRARTNGAYWVKPDSSPAFQVYCDMENDGGGWTLIGKGREGWTWDNVGQGTVADLVQNPDSNTVSTLPATTIDALVGNKAISTLSGAVRVYRHGVDQDWIFNYPTMTGWDWRMNVSKTATVVSRTPTCSGIVSGNTIDTMWCGGANDINRIFTSAWGGHNNVMGWSGGASTSCTGYGSDAWCYATEGHAILRTQVWIKSTNLLFPTWKEISPFQ